MPEAGAAPAREVEPASPPGPPPPSGPPPLRPDDKGFFTLVFGRPTSFGNQVLSRSRRIPMPHFGSACVCCGKSAMGRVETYVPEGWVPLGPGMGAPVCEECAGHAVMRDPLWFKLAVPVLGALLLLGGYLLVFNGDARGAACLGGFAVGGAAIWAYSRRDERKMSELRASGHHPRMRFSVADGSGRLSTTHRALAETLQRLNPNARPEK